MEKIEKFKNENMNLKIKNFNLTNELQKANSEITELKQKYRNQNKITDKLIEENEILREKNGKLKDEIDIWKKRYELLKKNLFDQKKNKVIKENKKKGEKNENNDYSKDSKENEINNKKDAKEEITENDETEEKIEDEKEGDKEIGEEKEDERNEEVKEDEKDEKKDVKKSKAKENKKEKEIRKKGEVGKTELILDNE